jgi:hypothetical protein
MQELPFTSNPAQAFTVALGGTKYDITARYNDLAGYWTFDLTRTQDHAVLVSEVPILIGQDLLGPYALQVGGLVATDLSGVGLDAGPDDLGDRVTVTWLSPAELSALAALGAAL